MYVKSYLYRERYSLFLLSPMEHSQCLMTIIALFKQKKKIEN